MLSATGKLLNLIGHLIGLSKSQQSSLSPGHGPELILCLDKILSRKDTKIRIESSLGLA